MEELLTRLIPPSKVGIPIFEAIYSRLTSYAVVGVSRNEAHAQTFFVRMRKIKQPAVKFLADGAWSCLTATAAMASDGGGPVSADISLCLIHGPDSG